MLFVKNAKTGLRVDYTYLRAAVWLGTYSCVGKAP